jgi:hypothetical protein
MTAIDEIMGRIDDALFSRLVVEQTDLRGLIAAAIAESMRDGAEQMREAAAQSVKGVVIPGWIEDAYVRIRALDLPTGRRQAVRLTDEQIDALRRRTGYAAGPIRFHRIALDVETAVLTKNGLGGSNG